MNCKSCGSALNGTEKFCGVCGNAVTEDAFYSNMQPAPVYAEAEDPGRVIGMWGYALSLFLMSLPVAGFILQIVWACGGTNSLNRRNLARGALFLWVVRLAFTVLLTVILMAIFARFIPSIIDWIRYYF